MSGQKARGPGEGARRSRGAPRILGIALWGLCLAACDLGATRGAKLANAHPSPEALATAVLDAIARRDAAALRALALDEQEFREHVWPELPAARPERNLPFSYVWGDLRQKSTASLARLLAREGGERSTLVAVRFAGETTAYRRYRVRRDTTLVVRDSTGATRTVRFFGSSLEKDGGWKVFSYVADD